eukprot:2985574-Rhodomonas_salina.5
MGSRYRFIREAIKGDEVVLAYCPTDANITYIFTKPLGHARFHTSVSSTFKFTSRVSCWDMRDSSLRECTLSWYGPTQSSCTLRLARRLL